MYKTIETLEPRRLLAAELGTGAGGIDRDFAAKGHVDIEASLGQIALLRNGEIVAASRLGSDIAVRRYSAAGAQSRSFGENGVGRVSFPGVTFTTNDIVTDRLGRIYVAGHVPGVAGTDIAVARLTSDGHMDTTFGVGGRRVMDFGFDGGDFAQRIHVRSDGKIILAGSALLRLTAIGKRDPNFGGGDGIVHTSVFGEIGQTRLGQIDDLEFTPDGRIVILGRGLSLTVFRYLENGTPDPSYRSDEDAGVVRGANGPDQGPGRAVIVRDDLSMIVVDGDITLMTANGSRAADQPFEEPSPENQLPVFNGYRMDAVGQRNDKIVVLFWDPDPSYGMYTGVARYNLDGSLDKTFGDDGVSLVYGGQPHSMVLSGSRILIGYSTPTDEDLSSGGMIALIGGESAFASPVKRTADQVTFSLSDRDEKVVVQYDFPQQRGRVIVDGFGYVVQRRGQNPGKLRVNLRGGNDRVTLPVYYGISPLLTIDGGDGNDHVNVRELFRSTVLGGNGNDTLYGGHGNVRLEGGGGNDRLYGGDGDDEIIGNAGNDRLFGGAGADALNGGTGNDILDGGAGRDALFGQDGHDLLLARDEEIDQLHGGGGRNTLEGDAIDEILDR